MAHSLRKVKKELEELDYYYSGFPSSNTYKGIRLAIDLIDKEIKRKYLPKQLK